MLGISDRIGGSKAANWIVKTVMNTYQLRKLNPPTSLFRGIIHPGDPDEEMRLVHQKAPDLCAARHSRLAARRSTGINHYQPLSTTINHHQPSL